MVCVLLWCGVQTCDFLLVLSSFLVVYVLAIVHYEHDFSAVYMCRVFYVLYIHDVSIVLLNIE